MEIYIVVIGKMENEMELDHVGLIMEIIIKVNGLKIKLMELE